MLYNRILKTAVIIGTIAYAVSEIYSYYKHKIMVNELNKFETGYNLYSNEQDKQKKIRETAVTNIIEHDKDSKKFCEQLFYNRIKFEDIPRNLLLNSFGTMLFMREKFNNDELTEIENYIIMIEKKHNVKLCNSLSETEYIIFGKTQIFTWYKPLFLRSIMYCAKKIFNRYLFGLNFYRYQFPNGYVVWVRKCSEEKQLYNPLILFHCSVGGCIPYYKIIKDLINGRTLILSELPGVSWENYVSRPPLLAEVAENLHDVVRQNNFTKYDLLCHSFGGLLCTKYFYRYHTEINKMICIESGVIVNHIFNIYSEFYEVVGKSKRMNMIDFLCASITNRDPYIQFYFHRDLSLADTILLGRPEEDNKEIHLVLSERDDKVPAEYYRYYIESKKLPYILKTFKERTHGAFIGDSEFQKYVIGILNN